MAKLQATKTYGKNEGITPHILNVGTT